MPAVRARTAIAAAAIASQLSNSGIITIQMGINQRWFPAWTTRNPRLVK
jgi:hypothetical protein